MTVCLHTRNFQCTNMCMMIPILSFGTGGIMGTSGPHMAVLGTLFSIIGE
eukprot:SAG11_NODE_659_length_7895_cov_18.189969_10_plen_50_part_00